MSAFSTPINIDNVTESVPTECDDNHTINDPDSDATKVCEACESADFDKCYCVPCSGCDKNKSCMSCGENYCETCLDCMCGDCNMMVCGLCMKIYSDTGEDCRCEGTCDECGEQTHMADDGRICDDCGTRTCGSCHCDCVESESESEIESEIEKTK